MAICGFCKKLKIRPTDFIFIVVMCVALYFVYKYEFKQISEQVAKQRQEKEAKNLLESFDKLQEDCINGDEIACQKINQDFIKTQ